MTSSSAPVVLAVTGASGAAYAVRLLETLVKAGRQVHLAMSAAGRDVLRHELKIEVDLDHFDVSRLVDLTGKPGTVVYHGIQDYRAPIASGSHLTAGMVICPCSGGTMSTIACGTGNNLIHRAAEVHLKERRKLIVVPRETPLSLIQIENMKRLTEAGAIVLPASPGWYHGVQSVMDLVDFVVARVLDQLGVEHTLIQRWSQEKKPAT